MFYDVWIPMPDGIRLSARIWRPALDQPVAGVFEFIPYRLEDFTAGRDSNQHHYFAGNGFASVRVDIRGTGSSEGICLGEYLEQEQDDAVAVIDWISKQIWCDGNVGMFGISWGGFNALQVAGKKPPALKAIIAVAATDDRYSDDVHYIGGCVLASEMLAWSATMLAYNSRPPSPRHGDDWKQLWLERLDGTPFYIRDWLGHQARDAFWKNGSVNEDYGSIECPVFIIGGQADGYINAVFRLADNLAGPVRAMLGPWSHAYPELATPGPSIGFLAEAVDWWRKWLNDSADVTDGGTTFEAWMQDSVKPQSDYDERPGRWISEPDWPLRRSRGDRVEFWLGAGTLSTEPSLPVDRNEAVPLSLVGSQRHGLHSGGWWSLTGANDKPLDQRVEDGLAMSFDGAVLTDCLELLGRPEVRLRVKLDTEVGMVSARLCDVASDGSSLLISRGVLNLTHRDGSEFPQPVELGEWMDVSFGLDGLAHRALPGHHLRLCLSNTLWPIVWPSPLESTLEIAPSDSCLVLPVYNGVASSTEPVKSYGPAEAAPSGRVSLDESTNDRTITHDVVSGVLTLLDESYDGTYEVSDYGVTYSASSSDRYDIVDGDPLSARATCVRSIEMKWDSAHAEVETESVMWADANNWYVTNYVKATAGDEMLFERSDSFEVPRLLN